MLAVSLGWCEYACGCSRKCGVLGILVYYTLISLHGYFARNECDARVEFCEVIWLLYNFMVYLKGFQLWTWDLFAYRCSCKDSTLEGTAIQWQNSTVGNYSNCCMQYTDWLVQFCVTLHAMLWPTCICSYCVYIYNICMMFLPWFSCHASAIKACSPGC